jgi:hypothetical protein
MNLLSDNFNNKPSGRLSFDVLYRGKLIEHFNDGNLIVDNSKMIQAHLLGGDVVNNSVTQIGFGTNGTAPVGGNLALTGAFTKAIDAVLYPTNHSVRFNFTLGSGENNGMDIMEFGLITGAGGLYARKVRATALTKTVDISITGSWIITF